MACIHYIFYEEWITSSDLLHVAEELPTDEYQVAGQFLSPHSRIHVGKDGGYIRVYDKFIFRSSEATCLPERQEVKKQYYIDAKDVIVITLGKELVSSAILLEYVKKFLEKYPTAIFFNGDWWLAHKMRKDDTCNATEDMVDKFPDQISNTTRNLPLKYYTYAQLSTVEADPVTGAWITKRED